MYQRQKSMSFLIAGLVGLIVVLSGCSKENAPDLVLISPHNQDIRNEFEARFVEYYQKQYGKPIKLEWRDVGGGSSTILEFLRNMYSNAESSGIDVLFGGGEYPCQFLASEGLLTPLQLADDVIENIPAEFCGMPLYDKDKLWCGNVLSAFGILYNKPLCERYEITEPRQWQDMGQDKLFNLVVLADPGESGSAAATYEMIVQSAPTWHQGWQRLLLILSNAKKITISSSEAANAPKAEAIAATAIDFYGAQRVEEMPEKLAFITPKGQTGFTPDPVAILKNPPHPQAAQAFVDFLLSVQGQAIWGLTAGQPDGPRRKSLNRIPIRKDFFTQYKEALPAWLQNPYAEGVAMTVNGKIRQVRYGVLAKFIKASAIENLNLMQKARQYINTHPQDTQAKELFFKLPDNMDAEDDVFTIAEALKDHVKADQIYTGWVNYFHSQYQQILDR